MRNIKLNSLHIEPVPQGTLTTVLCVATLGIKSAQVQPQRRSPGWLMSPVTYMRLILSMVGYMWGSMRRSVLTGVVPWCGGGRGKRVSPPRLEAGPGLCGRGQAWQYLQWNISLTRDTRHGGHVSLTLTLLTCQVEAVTVVCNVNRRNGYNFVSDWFKSWAFTPSINLRIIQQNLSNNLHKLVLLAERERRERSEAWCQDECESWSQRGSLNRRHQSQLRWGLVPAPGSRSWSSPPAGTCSTPPPGRRRGADTASSPRGGGAPGSWGAGGRTWR